MPIDLKYLKKTLPVSSGIYLMKNEEAQVIYVGKAKNLRNRVLSYFQSSKSHTPKTKKLVQNIDQLEVMITNTEAEALLLERTLIRLHDPHYNILFRDDKTYPYIVIDKQNKWPRIKKQRHRTDPKSYYIGPYTSEYKLSQVLKAAHKIFPLVRCSEYEFKNAKRPCNYYDMKLCLGPCVKSVDPEVYSNVIDNAINFMKGNDKNLEKKLTEKMQVYSDLQEYELAAMYRDQIESIKNLNDKQSVLFSNLQEADFIGYHIEEHHIAISILKVRDRALVEGFHVVLEMELDDELDVISQFVMQYYPSRYTPSIIYTSFSAEDWGEVPIALQTLKDSPVAISFKKPEKGEKHKLLLAADENARHQLTLNRENEAKNKLICQKLKEDLRLETTPYRIECFDISNLGAEAMVGSNVCFTNARPDKKEYRIYNVDIVGQNDFAALEQVVRRRLERGVKENKLPDLIVIDGGKPQLHAMKEILQDFKNLKVEFIALAKARTVESSDHQVHKTNERVLKPGWKSARPLDAHSLTYRILTQVRDEAHRFAIHHHRRKRSKQLVRSQLDEIKGIGPASKKRLLQAFTHLDNIRRASVEELRTQAKLSEKQAQEIKKSLR